MIDILAESKRDSGVNPMRRAALIVIYIFVSLGRIAFAQVASPTGAAEMKQAPVTGGELKYETRGDGEPVLFIHGALFADSFLPLMDEPSLAGYRLIRYHRAGYTGSTAPGRPLERQAIDAVALLRHLGVERGHIVGHSSGALIALQVAISTPGVVRSLVLLEPPLGTGLNSAHFAQEVIEPARKRYRAGDKAGAVETFMRGVAGPDWRRMIARTVPGGPEEAEQNAATFFSSELGSRIDIDEEKAKRISPSTPILYVWGSDTRPHLKEGRDVFHAWFPNAEDHLVRGVGHLLQMEDPRAVAEAIAGFLGRHAIEKR
jgi:pimeloyl-ACP methyl ester carboxylesterase